MKVQLITTVIKNGAKKITKENLKSDDIRLEMLKNIKDKFTVYNILDCNFNYKCSQTKFGFKVTETVIQNRITKEIEIKQFLYH